MQQTNIIGDTCKERRIDYDLIDRLNKECEVKARKTELGGRLAGKEKEEERKKPATEPAQAPDRTYIKTPNELRNMTSTYSLQEGIYLIDFDIIVPETRKLILEPGVELHFTEDAGIICKGKFEAKGKEGLEILLTAKNKTKGWRDVYLDGPAKAIIDYTKLSYGRGREISENSLRGGAIFVNSSKGIKPELRVNNCIFENNYCRQYGGAIYNSKGNVVIGENNIFKNNSVAQSGGAIENFMGYIKIKNNNIFENNFAKWYGGAIRNFYGTLEIDKSKNTFIGNRPHDISQT